MTVDASAALPVARSLSLFQAFDDQASRRVVSSENWSCDWPGARNSEQPRHKQPSCDEAVPPYASTTFAPDMETLEAQMDAEFMFRRLMGY